MIMLIPTNSDSCNAVVPTHDGSRNLASLGQVTRSVKVVEESLLQRVVAKVSLVYVE